MSSIFAVSQRNAARPGAAVSRVPELATRQQTTADRAEQTVSPGQDKAGSLLCGLVRPKAALHTQERLASEGQRDALAQGLIADLSAGDTARRHETGVSKQFISDAPRSNIFLVPQGGDWRSGEDIRPPSLAAMPDTVHKLTEFCDNDRAWAFRASQLANQTLANNAMLTGFIGGHGLAGRYYRRSNDTRRLIVRCNTVQRDTTSPEHERLELRRVGPDTLRLAWHQNRDVSSLQLEGRAKPKKVPQEGAGYAMTVCIDIDRPKPGEQQPVRVHSMVQHVRLPRSLDP